MISNKVVLPSPFRESPRVDSLVRSAKTTLNPEPNSVSFERRHIATDGRNHRAGLLSWPCSYSNRSDGEEIVERQYKVPETSDFLVVPERLP